MWRVLSRASPGSRPLPPGAPRRRRGRDRAPAAEGGARPAGPGRAERRRGHFARGPRGLHLPRRWSPPSPAAHRAARVRAVRTPAAPRLRPVSRRVSRGGGHSGPGKRSATARHAAARPSSPAGAPASVPKPSVPAARGPRVPSALGRRRFARCFSPHSLGPQRARTPTPTRSAPAPSGRAHARASRSRAPRAHEGVPSGPAHAHQSRRAGWRRARWRLRREVWWVRERFQPPPEL